MYFLLPRVLEVHRKKVRFGQKSDKQSELPRLGRGRPNVSRHNAPWRAVTHLKQCQHCFKWTHGTKQHNMAIPPTCRKCATPMHIGPCTEPRCCSNCGLDSHQPNSPACPFNIEAIEKELQRYNIHDDVVVIVNPTAIIRTSTPIRNKTLQPAGPSGTKNHIANINDQQGPSGLSNATNTGATTPKTSGPTPQASLPPQPPATNGAAITPVQPRTRSNSEGSVSTSPVMKGK